LTPTILEWLDEKFMGLPVRAAGNYSPPKIEKVKSLLNTTSSILYGNNKFFVPRWRIDYALKDPQYFNPSRWTCIYDNSPLIKTKVRSGIEEPV
jgi:hypothetical protein